MANRWIYDAEELRRLYICDRLSILSIASQKGVGYRATRNALLREAIPLRRRNTVGLHALSPETREKIRQSKLGPRNPNYGKKPSEQTLRILELGRKLAHSEAARRKKSQNRIKRGLSNGNRNPMAKPENVRRWARANALRPNRAERKLNRILAEVCPGEFELNVEGTAIIGNKIPDFVEVNGNRLIELYGDYWHQGEDPQDRMDFFRTFGYETLVVWESELSSESELVQRIRRFVR